MDKDWLENNLRNRFDEQEAPMDMEAEWAALQNRRQPKKSKRFLFWWFGGLGSIVILAALGWQLNTVDLSSDQYDSNIVEQEMTNKIASTDTETITTPIIENRPSIETEMLALNDQDITSNNQIESSNILGKSTVTNDEVALSPKQQIGNKNIGINEKPAFIIIREEQVIGVNTEKTTSILSENIKEKTPIIDLVKPSLFAKQDVNYFKNNISVDPLEYAFQIPVLEPWEELPEIDDLPQYNRTKYSQGVGIHIGYGWNNRTLEAENASSRDIVNRRNDAELTLDVIDLSLSYRRLLNQKVYVEGHLGVQQAMDRLNDSYSDTESMFIENQPIVIRNLPDGTTETEMGTIEATIFNSVEATLYQTYRQAYGSVWIGFYDQTEADWIVSFAAGLDVAIWNNVNGNTFKDADSIGEYAQLEELSYKQSGVLSALMRLEGSRLIGETNEIGLGIQGKINISDNYNDINISERRQWITGNIFFRKWF